VDPTQRAFGPVIVGKEFTVTVTVLEQPFEFVYVMRVVPKDTAVINPVFEIVATPVLFEVQGLLVAAVADPVSCVVALTQTVVSPEIVGKGLTVTNTFWELLQPVDALFAITV
jgi:hypothetical protein